MAGFASASSLLSFMVFCLLYVPCFATISVLSKEIGGRWTAISVAIELLVAYVISFVVYQVASACEMFGVAKVAILLAVLGSILISLAVIVKRIKGKGKCTYCNQCKKNCNKR